MDKQTLLNHLQTGLQKGEISREDLLPLLPAEHSLTSTKALYGVGGLIVTAGIIFLIQQMWDSFSAGAQIITTLGSSLALYAAALFFRQNSSGRSLSNLFFIMSAVIMPIGIYVTLHHLLPGNNLWSNHLIMSTLPTVTFFVSYRLWREPLLFFTSLLFATWAFYALVGLMLDQVDLSSAFVSRLWAYFTLLVGISYGFLAYHTAHAPTKRLTSALFFLSAAGALGAGFALTFLQDPWLILYFLLILASIYLSTLIHRRSLLLLGALALIAHLTHLSFEYFADSLSWPLALIISGFTIIGVGYGTYHLNRRFLQTNKGMKA